MVSAEASGTPQLLSPLVGRERELRWLDERLLRRGYRQVPIVVAGAPGTGKTALLDRFFASRRMPPPIWISPLSSNGFEEAIRKVAEGFSGERPFESDCIIIDDAEILSEEQAERAVARLFNYKRVRNVILLGRRVPPLRREERLTLEVLSLGDITRLLEIMLPRGVPEDLLERAAKSAHGLPLAIAVLESIQKTGGLEGVLAVLNGTLYDASTAIAVPSSRLIAAVSPQIIPATAALIDALKRQPESIYSLSPRQFEELLAELLTDMGYEVELTPPTRDGGKDILAYLNTDLGKLLCLVEAKRLRRDRKVGVELVRTLYGTLCDYQANSAMLVTTSGFSSEARDFQKKHKYQLALREFGDIVQWLQRYKHGTTR